MAKMYVYSKNGCPNCILTKNYLTNREIPFEERNTDEKPQYKGVPGDLGYMQYPVIVLEHENHEDKHGVVRDSTSGFNVPALDKMIKDMDLDQLSENS